jgi:hypothetical protein
MMVFDLIWVANLLSSLVNVASASQVSRAARAVRVGSRICRLIRLIRLMRIMQLYRKAEKAVRESAKLAKKPTALRESVMLVQRRQTRIRPTQLQDSNRRRSTNLEDFREETVERIDLNRETETGQTINYNAQKGIVLLVVVAIVLVPLLQVSSYYSQSSDRTVMVSAANFWNATLSDGKKLPAIVDTF